MEVPLVHLLRAKSERVGVAPDRQLLGLLVEEVRSLVRRVRRLETACGRLRGSRKDMPPVPGDSTTQSLPQMHERPHAL